MSETHIQKTLPEDGRDLERRLTVSVECECLEQRECWEKAASDWEMSLNSWIRFILDRESWRRSNAWPKQTPEAPSGD